MADEIRKKTRGQIDINPKQMRERFKTYRAKYKKAQVAASSTGFGLTEDDRKSGIHSISEKLNQMCPFYDQMDMIIIFIK